MTVKAAKEGGERFRSGSESGVSSCDTYLLTWFPQLWLQEPLRESNGHWTGDPRDLKHPPESRFEDSLDRRHRPSSIDDSHRRQVDDVGDDRHCELADDDLQHPVFGTGPTGKGLLQSPYKDMTQRSADGPAIDEHLDGALIDTERLEQSTTETQWLLLSGFPLVDLARW